MQIKEDKTQEYWSDYLVNLEKIFVHGWAWTRDLQIFSLALYRLSYPITTLNITNTGSDIFNGIKVMWREGLSHFISLFTIQCISNAKSDVSFWSYLSKCLKFEVIMICTKCKNHIFIFSKWSFKKRKRILILFSFFHLSWWNKVSCLFGGMEEKMINCEFIEIPIYCIKSLCLRTLFVKQLQLLI